MRCFVKIGFLVVGEMQSWGDVAGRCILIAGWLIRRVWVGGGCDGGVFGFVLGEGWVGSRVGGEGERWSDEGAEMWGRRDSFSASWLVWLLIGLGGGEHT